jgi:GT2 family glycosyltransferase
MIMKLTVLIPTYNRPVALAATLTALVPQTFADFKVVIADQSETFVGELPTIRTIADILELHGNEVHIIQNLPKRGIAQQREFLLEQCETEYALFIDDDVILEKDVIERMVHILDMEKCGFVGMGLIGLSYKDDVRPHEQAVEFWDGRVEPEVVRPHTREWQRYKIHNAANLLHMNDKIGDNSSQTYKVAWIGGCILYDTAKLREVGGFSFWHDLPEEHCGEDVLVQLKLMERFGGCGILPSGAYHQEVPTTISNREVNAPEVLI